MEATLKRKNTRRILILALVTVMSWRVFYPVLTQPLQEKRDAIARESQGIDALRNQLGLYSSYLKQVSAIGKTCLPADSMTAAIRYQEWVRDTCEAVGIADPNITIREPVPEADVGAKVQVTVRSRTSLEAVGNLADALSSARISHRITKCELRDWDAIGNTIGLNLELDALSLKDNPTSDPSLLSQDIVTRGLGSVIDSHKSFSRYVPPKPVIEEKASEAVAVSTAPPRPSRLDLLNAIVLVGVTQRNGSPRALFRDNLKNLDLVFELNNELRIDDFAATVASIEGSGITLVQGDRLIQVSLGQSLRQSVESQSDNIY